MPPLPAKLKAFVDSELGRVPVLIEQIRRQTIDALQRQGDMPVWPSERMIRFDLGQILTQNAQRFCEAFASTLRREVLGDPGQTAFDSSGAGVPLRLALVDDDSLSVDVELSRAVEHISTVADWELRELQTFTSALSGLPHVSVDSNPLRPEAFVHALWQATLALALPPAHQALVLRAGTGPLASGVQRAFAAACSRLEMEGVNPSQYAYRTVSALGRNAARDDTLASLLERLPPNATGVEAKQPRKTGAQAPEMLPRLFQVVLDDTYVHPEVRALIGRLQSSATMLAQHDSTLFTSAVHPLWKLVDALALQSATHPNPADPSLTAWLDFASDLLTSLQSEPVHDARVFQRCVDQLSAYSAAQFNAQVQQVSDDIEVLKQLDLHDDQGAVALHPAAMETVPAALLLSATDNDEQVAQWLDQQKPGQWYRIYIHGRWTITRLLWRSNTGDRWLLTGQPPKRSDALTRAAMVRLRAEKLIRSFVERDLVRRAARRLTSEIPPR